MMRKSLPITILLLIFTCILLSGCNTAPIPELKTQFDVLATQDRIDPNAFWVASGTQITLTITNQSPVHLQVYIIDQIPSQPITTEDLEHAILSAGLKANTNTQVKFTAPMAAGEYAIRYADPDTLTGSSVGTLIVVVPGTWMDR
jgi:hypothetical protein